MKLFRPEDQKNVRGFAMGLEHLNDPESFAASIKFKKLYFFVAVYLMDHSSDTVAFRSTVATTFSINARNQKMSVLIHSKIQSNEDMVANSMVPDGKGKDSARVDTEAPRWAVDHVVLVAQTLGVVFGVAGIDVADGGLRTALDDLFVLQQVVDGYRQTEIVVYCLKEGRVDVERQIDVWNPDAHLFD